METCDYGDEEEEAVTVVMVAAVMVLLFSIKFYAWNNSIMNS
jgi:hypothetical protein